MDDITVDAVQVRPEARRFAVPQKQYPAVPPNSLLPLLAEPRIAEPRLS